MGTCEDFNVPIAASLLFRAVLLHFHLGEVPWVARSRQLRPGLCRISCGKLSPPPPERLPILPPSAAIILASLAE